MAFLNVCGVVASAVALRLTPAALTKAVTAPRTSVRLQYGYGTPYGAQPGYGTQPGYDAQHGEQQYNAQYGEQQGYNAQYGEQQGYNAQYGERQGYGSQVLCRLAPATGVYSEYSVRNGEDHVLGRYDMTEQDEKSGRWYVSRAQCLIFVAADGTPTLVSIGKNPTGLRAHQAAPWYGLKKNAQHVLVDGEQIALNVSEKSAVYTCQLIKDGMAMSGYPQQGFGQHPQHGHSQQGHAGYGQQGFGQQGYPQYGGY